MEQRTEDRRTRLTKRLIRDALVERLKTEALHAVTVKALCETADVNRCTFYRHYDSIHAVYGEVWQEVSREIGGLAEKTPPGPGRLRRQLTAILAYVEQNRDLFLVLLSENGAVGAGESLTKIVDRLTAGSENSEFQQYCTQFLSAGLSSIVWIWLNKDPRIPAKELAGLINALLMHGIKKATAFAAAQAAEPEL